MPLATSGSSYKDVSELWMKRAHWKLGFNCLARVTGNVRLSKWFQLFFMFPPILGKISNLTHVFHTG